ncbi:MAG: ABC transporter substrate-binding protein [Micrococcales bacterium]
MKRIITALAASALVALTLSACSPSGSLVAGSSITVAELAGLDSFNADVPSTTGAQQSNTDLANLIRPSFFSLDATGKEVANTSFGSVKVTSNAPFTVVYKLTGAAKWSDGQQVTADDLLLSWLAARDPLKAGFTSNAASTGLKYTTAVPVESADHLSLTITFDHGVADWQTALQINAPAHMVAERAFQITDATAAITRFRAAVYGQILEDQTALATHYVNAFAFSRLNIANPALKVSAGAYNIESFTLDSAIVLKANPSFNWGNTPRIEKVTIRFYTDSASMVAAMQNKSVDIAALQESGLATLSSLVAEAKANGASYKLTASNDVEAVLLNHGTQSVFANGTDTAKATALRSAILNLIPRVKIQAGMIADSPVIDARSWIYSSASSYYQPFVQANGSQAFTIQNAELAAEQLAKVSIAKPVAVRVLFDANNPRAKQVFELLGQYASNVGFNLIDASSKTPAVDRVLGAYDLYITEVPLGGEDGGNPYWFAGNSLNNFSDAKLDELLVSYGSKTKQIDRISALKDLDTELYSAGFGLPLYQVPSLLVYSKKISALVPAPYGGSATYGYWNWQLAGN